MEILGLNSKYVERGKKLNYLKKKLSQKENDVDARVDDPLHKASYHSTVK
jgi:hypothetical protein